MNTIARVGVPGLTKVPNAIQIAVLIALSIITVWMLYVVPSWQAAGDPFLLATIASAVRNAEWADSVTLGREVSTCPVGSGSTVKTSKAAWRR